MAPMITTMALPGLGMMLPEGNELDAGPIELIEDFEEVPTERAMRSDAQTEDHIEAAAAGIDHHIIETWPARLRAGDLVGELRDDLIATLSGHLAKIVKLRLEMLIDSRDPQIQRGALHAAPLRFLSRGPYLAT